MQYTIVLAALAGSVIATPAVNIRQADGCASACSAAYNTCRGQKDANFAFCASGYASCLGYAPFDANGSLVTPTACSITTGYPTATSTPVLCNAAAIARGACNATAAYVPDVYTTEVVTELTTYCPASTTLTVNSKTYTIHSETTLTIKDCPCTITKPVPSSYTVPPATTAPPAATTKTYSPCDQVYNSCVAAGNGSPNLAACAGSSASCAATATATYSVATATPKQPTGTGVHYPTTTNPGVVVTAAAGAVKPAMALLAVGAVAFL